MPDSCAILETLTAHVGTGLPNEDATTIRQLLRRTAGAFEYPDDSELGAEFHDNPTVLDGEDALPGDLANGWQGVFDATYATHPELRIQCDVVLGLYRPAKKRGI